mmetsp:Transcript_28989/g.83146  ORF Transcript_28989/g.83146 Transcript_28989/m.83146 type:complete len:508 (+) Transcript_28989:66-1589(+)
MFFGGHAGGGFPGQNGLHDGKAVDTTKFYALLEVERSATEAEVKKAYRKLAVKHHPDKGGDPDKFKEISRAYEVLSDQEKRSRYDRFGEEGLEAGMPGDSADTFDTFVNGGRGGNSQKRRARTKDIVHRLPVTLDQLYNGGTKRVTVTRQVIDRQSGVRDCPQCDGRGVKVEVHRMGQMVQHLQSQCDACAGAGKRFRTISEQRMLDVQLQRGAPDGHKVTFREQADEHPDADTGDVVFVLQQEPHPVFKRRGADLFVERRISLVEALCGFALDVVHLDGRKLFIKTTPGDVAKPMASGFDPLAWDEGKPEWEVMENCDCPGVRNVAEADATDVQELKAACATQLRRKGIDVGVIVVDGQRAYFKQCSRDEALANRVPREGTTMYVATDLAPHRTFRTMKAVRGEGMPTFKNPFVHGNLFLILSIEFPDALTPKAQVSIRSLLPPPPRPSCPEEVDDDDLDVHTVADMDPVLSQQANRVNMMSGAEAYDEEQQRRGQVGGNVPCPVQ